MSKIKDQFFAEKTFALLMSAQNTNNREQLFKGGGIPLAMIKKTLFNIISCILVCTIKQCVINEMWF